ncbi:MAG: beta-ketoacyl synthase N-terminal-like domain-containing protein [Planctomycetota bacterium]|nr:beta-ketoacyl synthase N-terminal-like domain-containing protein [Planctomycetota bacterium]
MKREVVITGMGVVSPIGIGVEPFWQSLLGGVSGVKVRPEFEQTELPFRLWAPVDDFDGRQYVKPRKAIKVMSRPIQFGFAAAQMAAEQAGLIDSGVDPDRIGAVFGTEAFFADPLDVDSLFHKCVTDGTYDDTQWGQHFMREIEPLWMLKYLPNMVASHISISIDSRGPSNTICHGESSGLYAVIEGAELIQRGAADAVIVGGTSCPLGLTGMVYRGPDRLSKKIQGDPDGVVRPFDADRDGSVLGEGAGAIVLETRQHAETRGAQVLARLRGYNSTFGPPQTDDFSAAIRRCLATALETSGVSADELAHLNAHGSALVSEDALEATGIDQALGNVPVVANKGHFGDIGAGASAIELVAAIQSAMTRVLPATLNCDNPAADCPVNVNTTQATTDKSTAAKLACSKTGQVCSVIVDSAV